MHHRDIQIQDCMARQEMKICGCEDSSIVEQDRKWLKSSSLGIGTGLNWNTGSRDCLTSCAIDFSVHNTIRYADLFRMEVFEIDSAYN